MREGVRVYRTCNRKQRQRLIDAFWASHGAWPGDVHFHGVWDTVGTLGECLHSSAVERWFSPTAPKPMPTNVRAASAAGIPICQDPHGGERNFHQPTPRSPTPPADRATTGC